jgi:hypothetical protein
MHAGVSSHAMFSPKLHLRRMGVTLRCTSDALATFFDEMEKRHVSSPGDPDSS